MVMRAFSVLCLLSGLVAASVAQLSTAKLETFRVGKHDDKGNLTVSDPGSEFEFKGTEDNIFFKVSLAAAASANVRFKVYIVDAKDDYAHQYSNVIEKGERANTHQLLLPAGSYTAKLVDPEDNEKVFTSVKINVVDKVGDRASGNQKAGQAKLWICQTVDDDWKPVGARYNEKEKVFEWDAEKNFDVLVKNNSKPFGTAFLGIIVHKQGADGKDTDFVDEWQSEQLDENKATMWCTVGGLPSSSWIKPGRYTVYIIDWYKRQTNEHPGNFKEYFAKVTLVVK